MNDVRFLNAKEELSHVHLKMGILGSPGNTLEQNFVYKRFT